jgi:glycosyltransferase involved in cell wall biosynthesis
MGPDGEGILRKSPNPARVLHLLGSLGAGGAEALVMNAFRHIDRTRVLFDVALYATPGFYDDEFRALGGRIFQLPEPDARKLPRYTRELRRILHQNGPFAAVHSHLYSFNGWSLMLAHLAGVPIRIAHSHSTSDGKPATLFRKSYHRLMQWAIQGNATHIVGCSRSACTAMLGRTDARVEVFPNAIDPADFPSEDQATRNCFRSKLGLSAEDLALVHVGRFNPPKNHESLIDIFAKLIGIIPRARLLLVGDGPLRTRIEERCRTMGLGKRVTFLGLRNDVPEVLSACDIFIFPSLREGLGNAAVEAQMAGLPCVVSEAVPGEADLGLGLLLRLSLAESAETWAEAVVAAGQVKRPSREERERKLLESGFDMRQSIQNWKSLYLAQRL